MTSEIEVEKELLETEIKFAFSYAYLISCKHQSSRDKKYTLGLTEVSQDCTWSFILCLSYLYVDLFFSTVSKNCSY